MVFVSVSNIFFLSYRQGSWGRFRICWWPSSCPWEGFLLITCGRGVFCPPPTWGRSSTVAASDWRLSSSSWWPTQRLKLQPPRRWPWEWPSAVSQFPVHTKQFWNQLPYPTFTLKKFHPTKYSGDCPKRILLDCLNENMHRKMILEHIHVTS